MIQSIPPRPHGKRAAATAGATNPGRPLVAILDNYDSFTHNVAQAFAILGAEVCVWRNDELTLEDLLAVNPSHLVVSPGPGAPAASSDPAGTGVVVSAVRALRGRIPMLGVCLGHQILASELGARVVPTGRPMHGKPDRIHHDRVGIFARLSEPFVAARYHSLAVDPATLPDEIPVRAWTEDGVIMGFGVPGESTWAVQFHPESFMTVEGSLLLEDFLRGVACPSFRTDERFAAAANVTALVGRDRL